MHAYRSHTCAELRLANVGEIVRLSGWVHRKRDHGHLLFVDLRDHYGITQIVTDTDSPAFKVLDRLRVESVVTIDGRRFLRARHLDQAEVRPIGILAHELGVHGDEGLLREAVGKGLKVVRLCNQWVNTHESWGALAGGSRVDKSLSPSEARRAIFSTVFD